MVDLQSAIEQIPASDVLVMLGDFNARVRAHPAVRNEADDISRVDGVRDSQFAWGQAVGRFGLGVRNQAGEDLLLFCAAHQLSVVNSFYRKKKRQRGTSIHPATKEQHLIDKI